MGFLCKLQVAQFATRISLMISLGQELVLHFGRVLESTHAIMTTLCQTQIASPEDTRNFAQRADFDEHPAVAGGRTRYVSTGVFSDF